MSPARVAGKRGLLPPRYRALPAVRYTEGGVVNPLPPPPPSADLSGGIGADAWQMLGNGPDPSVTDQGPNFEGYGDCGVAATEHNRLAKAAVLKALLQPAVTGNATCDLYMRYTNGQDIGVDLGPWVEWLLEQGLILGYGRLDHSNPDEVKAAVVMFDGVVTGHELYDDAETVFESGGTWAVEPDATPDPQEGHALFYFDFNPSTDVYVSWGQAQQATPGWTAATRNQAWAILTNEDLVGRPDQIPALAAILLKLGGKVAPSIHPAPAPAPAPTPDPAPTPAPAPSPAPAPQPTPTPTPPAPAPPPGPIQPEPNGCWFQRRSMAMAAAEGTEDGITLPSWSDPTSIATWIISLSAIILGILGAFHVDVPSGTSGLVASLAPVAGFVIAAIFTAINGTRVTAVHKAAIAAGYTVKARRYGRPLRKAA